MKNRYRFTEEPEPDFEKAERIDRAFREIEARRNPQLGCGPDEEMPSDFWELATLRDQYRG